MAHEVTSVRRPLAPAVRNLAPAGERQRHDNGRIVGREGELRQIEAALSALAQGTSVVLEVTGDPGFGKTRLLTEILAGARRRRITALAGRAGPGAGSDAFALFADALDDHLARWTERQELPPDLLELLSPVLPAVRRRGATLRVAQPPGDQSEIIRALRRLLGLLAADGMALMFDDVHLADAQSLAMLDHLVRHPVPAPLLVAVAHRPRQATLRLRSMLAAGAEDGGVRKIMVGPLGLPDAAGLLGPEVAWDRVEALHRDTGGNPRYLLTLARRDEAAPSTVPVARAELAGRLEVLLLAELDGLSATDMAVAAAAAVLGDQFRFDGLVTVSGLDDAQVSAGLDALMHRDLVRPLTGPLLGFRDRLIAKAVYTIVHPVWRVEAHHRALSWATDNGGTVTQCARHAARSARSWSPQLHALLLEAALSCLHAAPDEAADWLRVILDLLPSTAEWDARRAEATRLLATALGLTGQFERSRDLLQGLLVNGQAGTGQAHLAAVTLCARMERMLGRYTEAAALLRRKTGQPGDDGPALVADLRVEAAAAAIATGQPSAALEHAAGAVAAARITGDDLVLADSLAMLALVRACGTEPVDRGDVDEVTAIVDGMSDRDLLPHVETLARLGWAELILECIPAAERHLRRGELIARRAGHRYPLALLVLGLSRVYLACGPLDAAAHWAGQAEHDARAAGLHDMVALAAAVRTVALMGGQAAEDGALPEAGGRPVASPRHRDIWLVRETTSALASAAWGLGIGDIDARLPALAADAADPAMLPAAARTRHFEWRICAALTAGDLASAEAHLAAGAMAAECGGLPGPRGYWLRARAAVLSARSEDHDAERLLADSSRSFAEAGLWVDQARADLVLAATLRRAGRPAEAAKAAERAADAAARIGARRLQARADQLRSALVASVRRPADDIFGALTERESEIARLVGGGGTSRQVAQHLHLSTRTVETHLARIYRKLDLSSRSGLARLVEREVYGTTMLLGG